MNVVAIDFETANHQASSACQLAAVVVRDSKIVAEHCWLIRPPRMYFSPRNIDIHGISPDDVRDAPSMEQVWNELSSIVDEQVLVAHNARFDIGVLVASLAAYDVACPDLQFTCTRALARAAWPGRSAYGLKPLGSWLGVDFRHHDALEDSRCCARIALTIERQHDLQDLVDLERRLRLTRGTYRQSLISSPRSLDRRRGASVTGGGRQLTDRWGFPDRRLKQGAVDATAIVTAAAQSQPLAGKRIVLLGPLRGLDLLQSQELIAKLGGVCQMQIGSTTDYVVACGTTLDEASNLVCAALAQAADSAPVPAPDNSANASSRAAGIRLLSERQFRALLPAGKSTVGW